MQLKWLSNSPKNPRFLVTFGGETQSEARERYQRWTSNKIEGVPKATDKYSATELMSMGLIGFYAVDLEAQIQRLNDLLKPLKEAVQIYESIDIEAEHDRAINQLQLIRPLVQAISDEIRDCVEHGYTVDFLHNGAVNAIAFYGGIEDVDMLIYSHIPDPKILSKGIRLGSVDEFVSVAISNIQ